MDKKMKILIGYDGSDYANYALEDLLKAGLPLVAEAIIMTIPAYLPASDAKHRINDKSNEQHTNSEIDIGKAAEMAKQASDLIRKYFPAWEIRANVAVGSVERNVAKKVNQWNPDLIVLGMRGCMITGDNFIDGLSQRIAGKARCSVRVARGLGAEPDDSPRVLLCVDDSSYAKTAVQVVASRNWPKGTEVRILTAVNPFDYSIPELLDKALKQASSYHRVIACELECLPGYTSSVVKEGEPAKVILKEAENWKPDSIFLAPRTRNHFPRLLFSGVSDTVIARAQCTVELVRTNATVSSSPSFQQVPTTSPAYD